MKIRKHSLLSVPVRVALVFALLVAALGIMPVPAVHAATVTVNITTDLLDGADGGNCTSADIADYDDDGGALSDISLREAICWANASAGADTIVVPLGTYTLDLGSIGDDTNAEGDLDIRESVTISGAGAGSVTIRNGYGTGVNGDRIFHIDPGGAVGAVDVTLTGMTIQDGAVGCAVASCTTGAGAIYKESTGFLTIEDSALLNNSVTCTGADCGDGQNTAGLLITSGGNLTIRCTTFTGNSAVCSVGGCEAGSVLVRMEGATGNFVLESSTISNNSANCDKDDCGVSEFIYYGIGAAGTATISDTTVSGNTLECTGDACDTDELLDLNGAGTVTITDLTVSNNTLECTGDTCSTDEILSMFGAGDRSLTSSRFLGNTQFCDGDGGCDVDSLIAMGTGSLTIIGTRISGNSGACQGTFCEVAPMMITGGGNLTIQNTTIENNETSCDGDTEPCIGGGIVESEETNRGNLVLSDSVIRGNVVGCTSPFCYVEEVFSYETEGDVTIANTTFFSNTISCSAEACETEELVEFDEADVVIITGLSILDNRLTCDGDFCDTDEVLSISAATSITMSNSQISNNTQSCVGEPGTLPWEWECDIDPLLFTYGTDTVNITNLTVSGNTQRCTGDACGSDSLGIGAFGLLFMVDSDVTLNNSQIVDNTQSCVGDYSPAVDDVCTVGPRLCLGPFLGPDAPVNINNTVIARNTATCEGLECFAGATIDLEVFPTSNIIESTIDGNTTTCTGLPCFSDTAGLFLMGEGTIEIQRTTISNNVNACDDQSWLCGPFTGAGIFVSDYLFGCVALTVVNSTISGNRTNGHGTGILHLSEGPVSLNNVTIVNNVADADGNGTGDGGDIYHDDSFGGPLNVQNTLIANNSDPTSDPDCFGTLASQGYNLIETVSAGCNIVGDTTGNITGQDPILGSLANNGGPTEIHALLLGSPAIDAGNDAACEATDQRGEPRPADGDQDGTAICDIGAYEVQPPPALVGGIVAPVNKLELLAPWLGLAALASLAAVTVALARRRRS